MGVKKIIIVLSVVVLAALSICLFSDNTQYKQIGDTSFYLLPNEQGQESFLYHNGGGGNVFIPISHEGIVHDVYWNRHVVIVKCSQSSQEHWYVIRNIKDYNYHDFEILHFMRECDYQVALDSLGGQEKRMEHTDGSIPWTIHIFNF